MTTEDQTVETPRQNLVIIDDVAPPMTEEFIPKGELIKAEVESGSPMSEEEITGLKKMQAQMELLNALPHKYRKLLLNGRWQLLVKTNGVGEQIPIGLRRTSNGEERYF